MSGASVVFYLKCLPIVLCFQEKIVTRNKYLHYLNYNNLFKHFKFSSAIEQLTLIMNVVGYPNKSFLHTLQQKPEVVEYLERLPNKPDRVDFKNFFATHISADSENFNLGINICF